MRLGKVQDHAVRQAVVLQDRHHVGQVGQRRPGRRRERKPGGLVQDLPAAVQAGERQERLGCRGIGVELRQQRLQLRRVLPAQGRHDPRADGRRWLQGIQEAAHHLDLSDVDLELAQAHRLTALDRHGDHLGIRLGAFQADQFHPDLGEFSLPARPGLVVAEHASCVGQPQRVRRLAQGGRHQASHLRREVYPQCQQAAGLPVHELEDLIVRVLAGGPLEDLQVLEGGRDDLLKTPAPEDREKLRLHGAALRGLRRREHPDALGDRGTRKHARISFRRRVSNDQEPGAHGRVASHEPEPRTVRPRATIAHTRLPSQPSGGYTRTDLAYTMFGIRRILSSTGPGIGSSTLTTEMARPPRC